MGISNNSHGKIDKETQSPLLKIFKEIMTREKDDPEKRNLLMEQKEDNKKRRQYSGSKIKSDRRSRDSSSSENRKRAGPYKLSSTDQRAEYKQNRAQSLPYQSETKDSWWFWQNQEKAKKADSCSCVSCALKRLVSSEYACIGCLVLIFTISIIVAFCVVFKNVPADPCKVPECKKCKPTTTCTTTTTTPAPCCEPKRSNIIFDSERLKRKIEMLDEDQAKNDMGLEENKKSYDDALARHMGSPGVGQIDFGPSFRELNSLDESDSKLPSEGNWPNVFEYDKNNDLEGNDKLKVPSLITTVMLEFYKKLVQTDAKIKNLKRMNQEEDSRYLDDMEKSQERSKRSLKLYNYPKRIHVVKPRRAIFNKHNKFNETSLMKKRLSDNNRTKRYDSDTEEPTAFVIEKKKLLIQYKPQNKMKIAVKKCSHAPKDSHTHENQLKHPFYKNTQRLDELLDRFLNKNLPDMMTDPFGLDSLFKHDKPNKCKHPKPMKNLDIIEKDDISDQLPKPKPLFTKMNTDKLETQTVNTDFLKMLKPASTSVFEKQLYQHEAEMIGKEKQKFVTASPDDFEVLLSVSTILNPDVQKNTQNPLVRSTFLDKEQLIDKVPNLRRLMQFEPNEEDENLGYEDFKEVLTDDMENHDELDKDRDRKKREEEPMALPQLQPQLMPQEPAPMPAPIEKLRKYNAPPGVHNPNWKGPMPLYPDELNTMIRHAAHDVDKVIHPAVPKEWNMGSLDRRERDVSDMEYVVDYLNKNDKLVEMAQAYSDYGVLDGKKDARNEKNQQSDGIPTDPRIKLTADQVFYETGRIERLREGRFPGVTVTGQGARKQRMVPIENHDPTTELSSYLLPPEQTGKISKALYYTSPYLTEGIRVELRPSSSTRREDDVDLLNLLSKHVKVKPVAKTLPEIPGTINYIHSALVTSYPDVTLVYSTAEPPISTTLENQDDAEPENGIIFALNKTKRSIFSTEYLASDDLRGNTDATGYRTDETEASTSTLGEFVQNLSNMTNNRKELSEYMEKIKEKNIRVYSTPNPRFNMSYSPSTEVTDATEDNATLVPKTMENIMLADPTDTIITINKSEVKMDNLSGNNFLGKILLTVENPLLGVEQINLVFDVPLVMDLNGELMMMNDSINFPNIYNQFEIFTETTPNANEYSESYLGNQFEDQLKKSTKPRNRREANVSATWSDNDVAEITTTKIARKKTTTPSKAMTKTGTTKTNSATTTTKGTTTNSVTTTTTQATDNISINLTPNVPRSISSAESDNMTLTDFFSMVSDWFKTLDDAKIDKPRDNSQSDQAEMIILTNSNVTTTTSDPVFQIYDSDMIENIAHKSRLLLSIDDSQANVTEGNNIVDKANVTEVKVNQADGNVSNITNSSTPINNLRQNLTTPKYERNIRTKNPKRVTRVKVKAKVFKRNAEDSNLISWNDMYDDEYGIQADKLDNSIRDKHSVKENDFIKRSGRWVHDKIKKFAANLKMPHSDDTPSVHSDDTTETKERVPRSIRRHSVVTYYPRHSYDRIYNRIRRKDTDNNDEYDYDADQKSIFTVLTANMKDVCKKAAKAVQETRNIGNLSDNSKAAHEESKQGSMASALMQQLVRLLTDLVDYQVQQKTCTKLPKDLQSFLEWLTFPKDEPQEVPMESFTYKTSQEEDVIEELHEVQNDEQADRPDEPKAPSRQESPDNKAQCLDCLHAVQELIEQYEELSDDEKSKMTGVKAYLDNQLRFLNKELSGFDMFTLFEKHNGMRYKRRLRKRRNQESTKHRPRRKLNKFIKNFGKKHTRTTASYYDGIPVTDMKRETVKDKGNEESAADHTQLIKRNSKNVDVDQSTADLKKLRNLKDLDKSTAHHKKSINRNMKGIDECPTNHKTLTKRNSIDVDVSQSDHKKLTKRNLKDVDDSTADHTQLIERNSKDVDESPTDHKKLTKRNLKDVENSTTGHRKLVKRNFKDVHKSPGHHRKLIKRNIKDVDDSKADHTQKDVDETTGDHRELVKRNSKDVDETPGHHRKLNKRNIKDVAESTTDQTKLIKINSEDVDESTASHRPLIKRNLKDVYFRAVAEAKKYATAKSIHKKDDITKFEGSSTNKVHTK